MTVMTSTVPGSIPSGREYVGVAGWLVSARVGNVSSEAGLEVMSHTEACSIPLPCSGFGYIG
jgi:hypothetical protein